MSLERAGPLTPRRTALSLVGAWALLGSGCATLAHGTHQTIHFESKPEGAMLTETTTGQTWRMPTEVSLWRRRHYRLLASMDGYRPDEVYLTREIPIGWWLADALTLGLGAIVDATTGGFYELGPERVVVVLEPLPPSPPAAAP